MYNNEGFDYRRIFTCRELKLRCRVKQALGIARVAGSMRHLSQQRERARHDAPAGGEERHPRHVDDDELPEVLGLGVHDVPHVHFLPGVVVLAGRVRLLRIGPRATQPTRNLNCIFYFQLRRSCSLEILIRSLGQFRRG